MRQVQRAAGNTAPVEEYVDLDLELSIPKALREIIASPQTDYLVPLSKPSELMEIFSELEDVNLFLIQQSQANEE